jgi:hypothetical protein
MTTRNETRHTPGPWDISWGTYQDGEGHEVCEYRKQGQPLACIAKVNFHDDQDGETKANARLIAASPELLDAVKMARGFMAMFKDGSSWTDEAKSYAETLTHNLDNAIAKVEGR